MSRQEIADTLNTFLAGDLVSSKLAGAGIVAILTMIWATLTSFMASVMALLFLADITLGVLKAIHRDGLDSFCWSKLARGMVKLAAAAIGVILFALGDMILQATGLPPDRFPFTTAFLFGASWGFFWSGVTNLGYFFPDVKKWIQDVIQMKKNGTEKPEA